MSDIFILIPSRIGSTRLENKPLQNIEGKSLIQRVFENALSINSNVYVATDSNKIRDNLSNVTNNIIMTSSEHISGTDRVYEASTKLNLKDSDLIINLQGDEPFLPKDAVMKMINDYKKNDCDVITLSSDFHSKNDLLDENCVKVQINEDSYANDFYRISDGNNLKKHIGIYGYSLKVLRKIINFDPSERELNNKLEQLRFLDNGLNIYVSYYDKNIPHGIDTQEDLINARKHIKDAIKRES